METTLPGTLDLNLPEELKTPSAKPSRYEPRYTSTIYKVDLEVVWKTIEADLPNLKVLVEKAIEGL